MEKLSTQKSTDLTSQKSTEHSEHSESLKSSKKVVLKYWKPIAIWGHNISNEKCSICKHGMTLKCVTCMDDKNVISKTCFPSKGKCGHGFHYHCIEQWQKKGSNTCPIDGAPWNFVLENMDNDGLKLTKIVQSQKD